MQEQELLQMWNRFNEKFEVQNGQIKDLNLQFSIDRTRPLIRRFTGLKIWSIFSFVIYLAILGSTVALSMSHYNTLWNYFTVSFMSIFIINLTALVLCIRQLALAGRLSPAGPVLELQKAISKIQLSILSSNRILFLQIPFWTTFYLDAICFPAHASLGWLIIQLATTLSATALSMWLFKNQHADNSTRPWLLFLLQGSGWAILQKAKARFSEIEEFSLETPFYMR